MPKLNLRIRIADVTETDKNPGNGLPDLRTTKNTYLILEKDNAGTDGNVEARNADSASNNADLANVAGEAINHANVVYFKLEANLAKQITRLAKLKVIASAETNDQRGEAWIMIKNVDDAGIT